MNGEGPHDVEGPHNEEGPNNEEGPHDEEDPPNEEGPHNEQGPNRLIYFPVGETGLGGGIRRRGFVEGGVSQCLGFEASQPETFAVRSLCLLLDDQELRSQRCYSCGARSLPS